MVRAWAKQLEGLHEEQVAHCFARAEPRRLALAYLKGLVGTSERKNSWQLAEAAGEVTSDGMQRLLNAAGWDAELVRDDLRRYVVEHLGDEQAVLVIDETGFLKKGTKSVGVQRQYTGTAGKRENCQIGVFLCYASDKGAAFVDRALYLPKSWAGDTERRKEASVPKEVVFTTKPELAKAMLERALDAGVPTGWVTGDAVYGGDRRLRMFLERHGQSFVLAVKRDEPLWALDERGPGQVAADRLAEEAVAPEEWARLSAGDGSKGPRLYDWALVPLFRLQLTEEERYWGHWLLVRRSPEDPEELAYYVVFAPKETTTLEEVVRVAGTRWNIESCFESAKGEFGLDEYEVRKWEAWHRHVTLSLLAHSFVSVVRSKEAQKGLRRRLRARSAAPDAARGASPVVSVGVDAIDEKGRSATLVGVEKTPSDAG